MSNSDPISRSSEHFCPNTYSKCLNSDIDQQHTIIRTQSTSILNSEAMDSTSPVTPTSAMSVCSVEGFPSCESLVASLRNTKSTWDATECGKEKVLISRLDTAMSPKSNDKTPALHSVLSSPSNLNFLKEREQRQNESANCNTTNKSAVDAFLETIFIEQRNEDQISQNREHQNPPGNLSGTIQDEKLQHSFTRSPILGQTTQIPLRAGDITTLPNNDTSNSFSDSITMISSDSSSQSTKFCCPTRLSGPRGLSRSHSMHRRSRSISLSQKPESFRSNSQPRIRSAASSCSSRSRGGGKLHSSTRCCCPPLTESQPVLDQHQRQRECEHKTQLKNAISHLCIPLVPLISVTTGQAHPDFPRSILQYHLLTHDQVDSLAQWYHQTHDNVIERFMYPTVIWRPWVWSGEYQPRTATAAAATAGRNALHLEEAGGGEEDGSYDTSVVKQDLDLITKRRRFGKFIGLQGCESPVTKQVDHHHHQQQQQQQQQQEQSRTVGIQIESGSQNGTTEKGVERAESLDEQMEREWRAALRRAEEEEQALEKSWRGRF